LGATLLTNNDGACIISPIGGQQTLFKKHEAREEEKREEKREENKTEKAGTM